MPDGEQDLAKSVNWDALPIEDVSGLDISRDEILDALRSNPEVRTAIEWANKINNERASFVSGPTNPYGNNRRRGGLAQRDKFVYSPYLKDQFAMARTAACDDVVSGWLDSTEALAFSAMTMEVEDPDQQDIWNQIAADLDLDSRLREMWRDLLIYSQVVVAIWWTTKTYRVRGLTPSGVKRKKSLTLRVPGALTLLDPQKIVPVGNLFFNQERLVYMANQGENSLIDAVLSGQAEDPIISSLFIGPYTLTPQDRMQIQNQRSWQGFQQQAPMEGRTYELNPRNVFRHTATRPQYEPFAEVRLASVFELLDRKSQLSQMDRAFLLGGTNYLILIKKGAKDEPGTPREIAALNQYVGVMAQIPVLVGDHRLNVEIVAPPTENVLSPEKYNAIDTRLVARLYGTLLTAGNAGTKTDDSLKLTKVIARNMENKRHLLRRALESHLWEPTVEANTAFDDVPCVEFVPKRIALDFDVALAQLMLMVREQREMSRYSFLRELGLDEAEEAKRLEMEEEYYDDIFKTAIPFNSPNNLPDAQPGQGNQGNQGTSPDDQQPAGGGNQPTNSNAPNNAADRKAGGRRGGLRGGGGTSGVQK